MTPAGGDTARRRASLELDLPREQGAPAEARVAVAELCDRVGLRGAPRHTLLLLVSEVVTNAVIHSKTSVPTPIRFSADADEDRVRIEVNDGGSGFAPPATPAPRSSLGGWGLRLVDQQARDWGVRRGGETLVWFELALGEADQPRV